MKKKVQDAINNQIREEFESAYVYLSMSSYMEGQNLPGFASWLRLQWNEELLHATKLVDHMNMRGATVKLQALKKPPATFGTPLKVFEKVLAHEKHITSTIHKLYELASAEKDYPLKVLMQWYIDEQVEEEDNASTIVEKIKLLGDAGPNLYLLDQELGQRTTEPA